MGAFAADIDQLQLLICGGGEGVIESEQVARDVALGEGDFYEIALEVFVGKDVAGDGGGGDAGLEEFDDGAGGVFFHGGFPELASCRGGWDIPH